MVAAHTRVGERVPPLESGDALTRAEFRRRYEASPHIKKAELVEGVVFVASPVRMRHHGRPHSYVMGWLVAYAASHRGIEVADNTTVGLDADNAFQPDAILFREAPGGAAITDDDYVEGPPGLVVEVAASSASYDLHQKLRVYRRAGVQEYIVWRVLEAAIDWFQLNEGVYEPLPVDVEGVIESKVFPGLRLPVQALIDGDLATVLSAVR